MRVKLTRPVNVLGLDWPAGEIEVADPFWAQQLLALAGEPGEAAQQAAGDGAQGDGTATGDGTGDAASDGASDATKKAGPGNGRGRSRKG